MKHVRSARKCWRKLMWLRSSGKRLEKIPFAANDDDAEASSGSDYGRRTRHAAASLDGGALQARGAAGRQVPPRGHPDQQLPQQRYQPDVSADAVSDRFATPARAEHVSLRSV